MSKRKIDARTLEALRRRAAGCRNCDLWRNATQTVFGAGPARAPLMLVGEGMKQFVADLKAIARRLRDPA